MKFPYHEIKQRINYFLLIKGNAKKLSLHSSYIFSNIFAMTRALIIVLIFEIISLQYNKFQNTESFDVIAPY